MDTLPDTHDTQSPGSLSEAGEAMRDLAAAALGNRYRMLSERAKRRQLTDAECSELDRLEIVLDTLQAMGGAREAR